MNNICCKKKNENYSVVATILLIIYFMKVLNRKKINLLSLIKIFQ